MKENNLYLNQHIYNRIFFNNGLHAICLLGKCILYIFSDFFFLNIQLIIIKTSICNSFKIKKKTCVKICVYIQAYIGILIASSGGKKNMRIWYIQSELKSILKKTKQEKIHTHRPVTNWQIECKMIMCFSSQV